MNVGSPVGRSAHRLKDRFREEATQAILEAAEQVFAERGLHAASMSEIADRAGVAVGTLYNHFKDREALLSDLMAQRKSELFDRLDKSAAELAKAPFRDQLAGFLRALFMHFEAHRRFLLIVMQNDGALPPSAPAMKGILERTEHLIKVGHQKRALKSEGLRYFPALLFGSARALIMCEKYGTPPLDVESAVTMAVSFFLSGTGK